MSPFRWRVPAISLQGPSVEGFAQLATALTVLLTLMLAHLLAQMTWRFFPGSVSPLPPPRAVAHLTVAKDLNVDTIVQAHIFGKVSAVSVAPLPIPATVTKAPPNLFLRGVSMAAPPGGGAIIADAGGQSSFVHRGEKIPGGGAILQEIQRKGVFLLRDNHLEVLCLPDTEPNQQLQCVDKGDKDKHSVASQPDAGGGAPPPGSGQEMQALSHYRDQIAANPAILPRLFQTEPVYQEGRLAGFRLHPGQEDGLLQRFGFEANDLVTSLNGIPLDEPGKMFELLRNLRNVRTLSVEVSRQGRTENIVLHFAQ